MKELLNSFNGGEISPVLAGRVDLPGLKRSCRIMRNFIAGVTGGAFRRPPLLHVGMALPGGVQLIPFNASTGAAYQLEAGDYALRVWTAAGSLVATMAAPWAAAQVPTLQWIQSNDVMWLTHPAVPPQELQRTPAGWTLNAIPWKWPPLRDENTEAVTIAADALTGAVNLTASAALFQPGHAGAYWQISHFRETGSVEVEVPVVTDASSVLTLTAIAVAGEKVSIGAGSDLRVYTYVAAGAERTAYQVDIGSSGADGSADNLRAAIMGTDSTVGTSAHPLVTAEDGGTVAAGTKATGVLTFTDNGLTNGTPDEFTVNGPTHNRTYPFADTLSAAYQVKRGATLAESIANAIKAVTGTGTAGVHYGTGTAAHADVDAVTGTAVNSILFTAKVAGTGGNAIATTVDHTSRMSFAEATLTGGVAGTVAKVIIKAKKPGALGNGIPVSETMASGSFYPVGATAGSSDYDAASDWMRIKGQWDFTTLGRWQGRVYIEQKNAAGGADVIQQFTGKLDENKTASGTADTEVQLRVRVAGMAGKEASDVPNPRFILEAVESLVHGVVRLVTVAADGLTATATVVSELHSTDATPHWREGAFSTHRGFPAATALHEEKLLFAGVADDPQLVYGSQPGDFRNFEETGLANGAWRHRFTSQQANPIRWMISARGLIIATSGGERVWDSGDAGITPLHLPIQRQLTFNGAEPSMPVGVGDVALFIARGGQSVLEYGYEQASQSYIAPDLTQLVDHLTHTGVKALAFQKAPFPVVWAVTNDGQLLACTYARREEVVAWCPQPVGGVVSSVSVSYGTAGSADEVWVAVTRDGALRLERLAPDHWTRLRTGGLLWHMDAAAVRVPAAGFATGLDHLEGRTVKILEDGAQVADQSVIAGRISSTAASVIVGLASEAALQPALFDFVTDTGTSIGKKFICKKVHVRFYQSRECQYAHSPGAETPYDVPFRDANDPIEAPPALFNGIRPVQVNGQFMDGVSTVFHAAGIHPLNILNMVPEFELHGQ